jgi:hypothetical protein
MCIPVPTIPVPTLGLGLNIAPPAGLEFSGDLNLCCKRLPFDIAIPVPLPPLTLNASASAVIAASIAAVQEYINSLPPECPLE